MLTKIINDPDAFLKHDSAVNVKISVKFENKTI